MKQEISRILRHDQSLFIEPMKRWFRLFGLDLSVEPARWAGGIPRLSDQESAEDIELAGESPSQGKRSNRTPAQVDPHEGQLDPELVRDVFTADITPADHFAFSECQSHDVGITVGADQKDADGEDGLSQKSTENSESEATEDSLDEQEARSGSTQLPNSMTRASLGDGEENGGDVSANSASISKHSTDAPPTTMVKTMVESISDRTSGSEQGLNLLPDGLEELFVRNARVNVGVKTLLLNLEPVNIRELTEELQDFAKSIGAIKRPE